MSLLASVMAQIFRAVAPPVGGDWTPAEITTALWLDAADETTVALNGSNVSQWNDKSGNVINAVQATAANQPEYVAAALNGLHAIDFVAATPEWLSLSSPLMVTANMALFIVLERKAAEDRGRAR